MPGIELEPKAQEIAAAIVSGKLTPDQAAAQAGVDVATVNRWAALYVATARAAFEQRAKAVLGRARSQTLIGGAGMVSGGTASALAFGKGAFGGTPNAGGTLGNWPAAPPPAAAQANAAPFASSPFGGSPFAAAAAAAPRGVTGSASFGAPAASTTPAAPSKAAAAPSKPVAAPSTAPAKPALPAVPAPPAKAPPPASVSPADFTPYFGKIDDTTLRQVARELVNSKRSGILVVRTPPDAGSVHFLQGNIVHADYRGLRGQDAFCKLLDAQHGSFELQPLSGSKERTIALDTVALIAECDGRRVQARALKKRLGSARQVFVLAELSKEQHAWLRPIDHQLVALFDGKRTVKQVVQKALFDEFTTLNQIAELLDKGLLLPASLRPMVVDIAPSTSATATPDPAAFNAIAAPQPPRHWGRWAAASVVALGGLSAGVLLPPQSRQVAVEWQGVVSQFGSHAHGQLNAWLANRLGSNDSVPQNAPSDTGAAAAAAAVPPNPLVPGDEASASCPTGSVWIAAGSFRMGSDSAEAGLTHSGPEHDVTVSHGYCIDRFEVTVEQYKDCVSNNHCSPASAVAEWPRGAATEKEWAASRQRHSEQCNSAVAGRWSHPINCLSWEQANTYCEAQNARLPSEVEWEFAARGSEGRTYPWGEQSPQAELLNGCGTECELWHETVGLSAEAGATLHGADDGFTGTAPVGSFPEGQTPQGVHDLAGNVAEWTADTLYAYTADQREEDQPAGARADTTNATAHTVRGGMFTTGDLASMSAASRLEVPNETLSHGIGFRCVRAPQ